MGQNNVVGTESAQADFVFCSPRIHSPGGLERCNRLIHLVINFQEGIEACQL